MCLASDAHVTGSCEQKQKQTARSEQSHFFPGWSPRQAVESTTQHLETPSLACSEASCQLSDRPCHAARSRRRLAQPPQAPVTMRLARAPRGHPPARPHLIHQRAWFHTRHRAPHALACSHCSRSGTKFYTWQFMPRVARHPRHGRSSYTSARLHMRRRAPHALACSRYNKSGPTIAHAGCMCRTARHPVHGRSSYTSARSFTRVTARRTHSPAAAAGDQARSSTCGGACPVPLGIHCMAAPHTPARAAHARPARLTHPPIATTAGQPRKLTNGLIQSSTPRTSVRMPHAPCVTTRTQRQAECRSAMASSAAA